MFNEINDVTGFANGDKFDSAAQVRDYFTVENLHAMVGKGSFLKEEEDGTFTDLTPTQETLDSWATYVIENRLHCAEDFEA